MTATPKLSIGMMSTGSLSKEVIFNEAMVEVDALLARVAASKSVTAPPGSPADGAVYIIPTGASGDWSGHINSIAFYYNGWHYVAPPDKIKFWIQDLSAWYTWNAGTTSWTGV